MATIVFLRESNGMNKVWRSSIALSMNTEGGFEFILVLPLKTIHSQCVSVAPAVWVLLLSAVIRSSSVAQTRNTEMRSVLSPYKQMHDELTNSIQTF